MTTSTTVQLADQCPTAPGCTRTAVSPDRHRVTAWFAALRGLYADLRRAWREGAALPHELPLRDYPIARR
jgi:hypothetical protein